MVRATDEELVARCRNGDKDAFGKLVDRYSKPLFNGCYRMVGSYEDAQDIVQTTFLKAYERRDDFDPKYKFFSWIYRIMVNESLNLIGRRKQTVSTEMEIASDAPSPEEEFDRQQLSESVQDALMAIREDYRAIVVLKYFGDLSYQELAFVFDLPEKTVKSRLYTARQHLSDFISRQGVVGRG